MEEEFIRKGMMNRIGWFTYLRLVFENTPKVADMECTVWKSGYLNELMAFQANLPLKSEEDYGQTTREVGFSFDQVYEIISALPSPLISFDDIIDVMVKGREISTTERKEVPPLDDTRREILEFHRQSESKSYTSPKRTEIPECSVPEQSVKPTDNSHEKENNRSQGLLIDFSFSALKKEIHSVEEAYPLLPPHVDFLQVKGIKLARQTVKSISTLPDNLLVLNISGCELKNLFGLEKTKNLRALNASNNNLVSIKSLNSCLNLIDLNLSHNLISEFDELREMSKLKLLDISGNPAGWELLPPLSTLILLNFTDPRLSNRTNDESKIQKQFPSLHFLNVGLDYAKHSPFSAISGFLHESAPPRYQNERRSTHTANNSRRELSFSASRGNSFSSTMRMEKNGDGRNTYRELDGESIGRIMESVSTKKCFVVNPRSIKDSFSKGMSFNNPVAAMMIAPATRKNMKTLTRVRLQATCNFLEEKRQIKLRSYAQRDVSSVSKAKIPIKILRPASSTRNIQRVAVSLNEKCKKFQPKQKERSDTIQRYSLQTLSFNNSVQKQSKAYLNTPSSHQLSKHSTHTFVVSNLSESKRNIVLDSAPSTTKNKNAGQEPQHIYMSY